MLGSAKEHHSVIRTDNDARRPESTAGRAGHPSGGSEVSGTVSLVFTSVSIFRAGITNLVARMSSLTGCGVGDAASVAVAGGSVDGATVENPLEAPLLPLPWPGRRAWPSRAR